MKKTLFFLFIFISANAQNKRTINLEIAGTLFSKINTEINNISDITLTGNINNEDIIVLRNMVQNGSLEYVDMFSDCHIDKIYCTGVPFSIKDDSFDERTKTECKLFVPNGMYNKYAWESKYWSEFKNIKEYNQNTVDNECVSFNNVNIRVIRRNIVLETVQNTHVSIYNINGTLVFSSSVKNNVSIPLQSGFYIVKYNDETKKIAIL